VADPIPEPLWCGDNSCLFKSLAPSRGMATNGGCRCFDDVVAWVESEKRWNRKEVAVLRRKVTALLIKKRDADAANERAAAQRAQGLIDAERAKVADLERVIAAERERSAGLVALLRDYVGIFESPEVESSLFFAAMRGVGIVSREESERADRIRAAAKAALVAAGEA
jgi:hypothetical protein